MEIGGRESTAIDLALDAWATAQAHLVKLVEDGGLDDHDDLGLLDVLRRVEQVRNASVVRDHRAIREAQARRLPESLSQPGMGSVLAATLRISRGEAARRVRASERVGDRASMTGQVFGPLRPALAAVQRTGDVSPEQVDICVRAIESVDRRGFDPAAIDLADEVLAGLTPVYGPKDLRLLAEQVARVDPDGTLPAEAVNADRRHLAFRQARDGMWVGELRLTAELGAKLTAVLEPLAAPRNVVHTVEDGHGGTRPVAELDPRRHGQRTHDALEEVCDRMLRSDTLPDTGGTPATVIVTIDTDDLTNQARFGVTPDGTVLPTATVRRVVAAPDVYAAVVTTAGVVLRMGRARRIATPSQTVALTARDRGCSFPGCQRPPSWCERHHVVAWVDGGPTDLDNLTLLCSYHHHHFEAGGWTCRMVDRLPTWAPPTWIDPARRPLRNTRTTATAAVAGVHGTGLL